MKSYIKVIAIAFVACGLVAAQDVTGRWVGTADTTDEAGTKRMEKHTIDIKMGEDGKLTGLSVSRSGTGGTPLKVLTDGGKVNLYAYLTLDGGEHLRWKL